MRILWVAIIAFWVLAIRMWIVDGPKVPLIFIGLWLAAFSGFPLIGWGGYPFMAASAFLAVSLIIVEKYNDIV